MKQFDKPILIIVYNRPGLTRQVLQAIKKVKPNRLYVCADGPKPDNDIDLANCTAVRNIFESIPWPCEVKRLFHPRNLGVALSPRKGLSWFFQEEEEGIILEDDCVPGLDFFPFCEQLLEKYRNNSKIFTINGGNLGYKNESGDSYTFSRFMNMTGWATWRRTAQSIDYDLKGWQQTKRPYLSLYKMLRNDNTDIDINWWRYWKYRFDRTIAHNNVRWWDYHWIFNQLYNKQYSIVPAMNLVTNIGFGDQASNTFEPTNPAGNIPIQKLQFPLSHPIKLKADRVYEENFLKKIWCYHHRISPIMWLRIRVKSFLSSKLK